MAQVDLARLSAPQIEPEVSFEIILAELQGELKRRLPTIDLTEAEPLEKLLEVYAWREKIVRERVNAAGKKIWLPYAYGEFLDSLGEFLGSERFLSARSSEKNPEGEDDDSFRARIRNARDLKSTAGARGTYIAHAQSFSFVTSVEVVGIPEIATVTVYPLKRATLVRDEKGNLTGIVDGRLSLEELNEVGSHLASEEVRPLTTLVLTENPALVNFKIHCKIKGFVNDPSKPALGDLRESIARWIQENHVPGRFVSVSSLYAVLHKSAVLSCEILSPQKDFEVKPSEVPFCSWEDVVLESETVGSRGGGS